MSNMLLAIASLLHSPLIWLFLAIFFALLIDAIRGRR